MQRQGIPTITGERLKIPVAADMSAGALPLPGGALDSRHEAADPIDAAISVTSRYGLQDVWLLRDDLSPTAHVPVTAWQASPCPPLHAGEVVPAEDLTARLDAELNAASLPAPQRRGVVMVYRCLTRNPAGYRSATGQLLVQQKESAEEASLRSNSTAGTIEPSTA